jgi:cell fate regulator YaaT (PSP1 superfamily)
MGTIKEYDCQRGCEKEIKETGEIKCTYKRGCCKLGVFNWLEGISQEEMKDLFEVRFKNTRKLIFRNTSEQNLKIGDIVVVEAQNGYDVGIITLAGAIIANQLKRDRIDPTTYEFRKIYRKARPADIQKWQEAIAREHRTMIRSRQMAADLQLNMKIGDVEFQGDGTKAIFYYIADERVDFRQLIKDFAEEFRIRIEMKQIGARQEAGLIGGLGVCGQALCCSRYMNNFQSITTQAARCQDLSLNPQKLAGQCGKLKCCINYEASVYVDAQSKLPKVSEPLHFEDGDAFLMKTDILKGMMWFSYDPKSMANMIQLSAEEVKEVIAMNRKGEKAPTCMQNNLAEVKDRWTATNASNLVPSAKGYVAYDVYSRFIEDGSFLRLKNITLGYTIPERLTRKFYVNKLRIYASANNLFLLTKYSGFDPEVNMKSSNLMPSFDFGAYPKNKAFTFGVELNF